MAPLRRQFIGLHKIDKVRMFLEIQLKNLIRNELRSKCMAQIIPPWSTINAFHNKLQEGEREIARYFDLNLSDDWEVYVQPFLNGSRPDIIILNPNIGVMIVEVKDWDLMNYCCDHENVYSITRNGKKQIESPVKQAKRYLTNLLNIIPELDDYYSAFSLGIYFGKEPQESVDTFFKNGPRMGSNVLLMGNDRLEISRIENIFKKKTTKKTPIPEMLLNEIRNWLNPPEHFIESCLTIELTKDQRDHAEPKEGHHRIRGVIGSGKTLVLAYRAAALAEKGHKVLLVTFNKTLHNYIHNMIRCTPFKFDRKLIVCNHFHDFCMDFLNDVGCPKPLKKESDDEKVYFKETIPFSVKNVLLAKRNKENLDEYKYDAILIDEGQDFELEWYNLLCQFLSQRNELVLMCDKAQNIYERDINWIYAGVKGFRGRWGELKQCQRLPPIIAREANRFAKMYLRGIDMYAEERQTELFDQFEHELRWISCNSKDDAFDQAEAAYDYLSKEKKQHPTDIVMLFIKKEWGEEMVKIFKDKRKLKVNHTFSDRHKKRFWMGSERTKMSTIHSFKGWELKNIIIVINDGNESENLSSLIYTAIGRTQGNLIVINRSQDYDNYGRTWPRTDKFNLIDTEISN